jgi:hypothetical protein
MSALRVAAGLGLEDAWLASGCVYQAVWNHLTGRPPDYGLKDYDLFYFDQDLSYEAEDRVIQRLRREAPAPLASRFEARNQARVHLWFSARFGEPYAPLSCSTEALERFLSPAFAVALRRGPGGEIEAAAPFGLDDCFAMRIRPNPRRAVSRASFYRVAAGLVQRWPEAVIAG